MKKMFYALCAVVLALCIGLSNVSAKEVTLDQFVEYINTKAQSTYEGIKAKKLTSEEVEITLNVLKSDIIIGLDYNENDKSLTFGGIKNLPDISEKEAYFEKTTIQSFFPVGAVFYSLADLFGVSEDEYMKFLEMDPSSYNYEKNGVYVKVGDPKEVLGYDEYTKAHPGLTIKKYCQDFKIDMVYGFSGLGFKNVEEKPDEKPGDGDEEELPDDGEEELPNDDEDNITDDTEEEEPEKNPSTGDSKINLILITITLMGGLSYIGYRRYKELKD